jgi:hypothetical protein
MERDFYQELRYANPDTLIQHLRIILPDAEAYNMMPSQVFGDLRNVIENKFGQKGIGTLDDYLVDLYE